MTIEEIIKALVRIEGRSWSEVRTLSHKDNLITIFFFDDTELEISYTLSELPADDEILTPPEQLIDASYRELREKGLSHKQVIERLRTVVPAEWHEKRERSVMIYHQRIAALDKKYSKHKGDPKWQ